ncbi:hypothetical protein PMAYCL1PPCAC_02668 [Pristionchus mayeri]|uniref:protein-serine/threonine phosphatase n=1 Tax=Pristionchus mayeri TaxID=1317129 RepID=A0AAN4Z5T7_9BILA|nr:hypothetical protein PMAYCL1PPCAC_02668 [Pristionchus mayeri]
MSNSIEEEVTSPGVKFINRRGDLALPFVPRETIKKMEKSVKSTHGLKGVKSVENGLRPVIKEVFTYSTSDDITILEEIHPKKKNFLGINIGGSKSPTLDEKELFLDLLRNGPRQFPFTRSQMKSILKKGKEAFKNEPSLIEAAVPATVYGDIHGQYSDLLRWLNLNGFPNETRCVFLGGIELRGSRPSRSGSHHDHRTHEGRSVVISLINQYS